jgi:uncharacterized protein YkwD
MKVHQIITLIVLATLTACTSNSIEEENELYTVETASEITISDEEKALLNIINEYRISVGKSELTMKAVIYPYAQAHNSYMMENNTISHDNFSFRSNEVKKTTSAKIVAENVARFFNTNESVLNGWLNSESHKNTLEGNYNYTVISISKDENGRKYYTQLFYR